MAEATDGGGFLERWLEFEQQARAVSDQATGTDSLRLEILATARRLGTAEGLDLRGVAAVQTLNDFIFKELGIDATGDLADPESLLLASVLARKHAYCIGIAALYMALAEQLGLPVFAVATPTHVFLRYDDGTTRVNIEPFQRGAHLSDEQYAREHRIAVQSVGAGVFLRNLTMEEFLARAENNLGVILSKRGDHEAAGRRYRKAIRQDGRFPAAFYNLGNDLLLRGKARRAARQFTRALDLYPQDVWALNNRGLAYRRLGREAEARADFELALEMEPTFAPARANLKR